jgi:hypothetical protein
MTWQTSLAIVTTSLILAGPAVAQTPSSPTTPGTPGSTTPGMPGSTTPGSPSLGNPSPTNPTFPCPPGQAGRPGSQVCVPAPTTR